MENKKVSIIGLGLIGGSLARGLKERLGIRDITAVNRSSEALDAALSDNIITRGFNELNQHVFNSDIIFICTPVKRAIDYIKILKNKVKPGCIITDVGSTKQEIISYINEIETPPVFIGGHPMAGTEKTGYKSGFVHLFENAYYVLTPCKTTTKDSLNLMIDIIKGIGAIPVVLNADEHDRITGCISHVPHILASTLVNMVREADSPDEKMKMLAAGGFKDITRIASSSPEMWENIVLSNKEQIKGILDVYVELIQKFKQHLDNNDSEAIYSFFESAKNYRDKFSTIKKGLINPIYDIMVDVVDKPGIIGELATILGTNQVNIKNIEVLNNREMEKGCLRISLPDPESENKAINLLTNKGFKVYK
jgi:prephenate dehydrogenase